MLRRYISTHRRTRLVRALANRCRDVIRSYENVENWDFAKNGERFVLEALSSQPFSCVFDVGANIGTWTLMAHNLFPSAQIHCFEILKSTAEELRCHTEGLSHTTVNAYGLSDTEGDVSLKSFPASSALTTVTDFPHKFEHRVSTGRVMRGDLYIEQLGIDHVNFLTEKFVYDVLDSNAPQSDARADRVDTFLVRRNGDF